MATLTLPNLVSLLKQSQLLTPEQAAEVEGDLSRRFPEPKALAKELLKRGWLTVYQINQVTHGRAQDLFLGPYVLLERLGEGGMGQVFKAKHRVLGRVEALKVIRKDRLANPDAIRRFKREIKAVSQLQHPNVVQAYSSDEINGTQVLALEYIDGTDLSQLVKKTGPLPIAQACNYIYQAAQGLQHAHERGLVHRDIKPANLLVTNPGSKSSSVGGVVKILDMGLARLTEGSQESCFSQMTQEGKILGTPDYIAPEQARNSSAVDIRADLYSLGCTFHYLLAGTVAFPGGTSIMEVLLKHQTEEPVPIEKVRPEVPPEVRAILKRLIARRPEDRYQTPAELVAALEPLVRGQSLTALPAVLPSVTAVPAVSTPNGSTIPLAIAVAATPMTASTAPAPLSPGVEGTDVSSAGVLAKHLFRAVFGVVYFFVKALVWLAVLLVRPGPTPLRRRLRLGMTIFLISAVVLSVVALARRKANVGGQQTNANERSAAVEGQQAKERLPDVREQLLSGEPLPEEGGDERPKEVIAVHLAKHGGRHWGNVQTVAYSPDGKLLASSGSDRVIRILDADTMKELARLKGHRGPLMVVTFSADGRFLTSLSQDGVVKQWDVVQSKELISRQVVNLDGFFPMWLAPGGNTVAVKLKDNRTLKLLDVATGREKTVSSPKEIQDVAISPDGKTAATLAFVHEGPNRFPAATLWDVASGAEIMTKKFDHWVKGMALSPEGKKAAVGIPGSNSISVLDLSSGKELILKDVAFPIAYLVFSPDGETLAVNRKGSVTLWNAVTGEKGASFGERVVFLAFSPVDKNTIATAGGGETRVRVWDVATGKDRLGDPVFPMRFALFSPDGNALAVGGQNGSFRMVDVDTRKVRVFRKGHDRQATCAAFAQDGTSVAIGTWDRTVRLGDVLSRKESIFCKGHQGMVRAVAFSPDGKTVASGSEDQNVKLWNASNGEELHTLMGLPKGVWVLAFSGNGQTLIAGGQDGSVKLWDLQDPNEPKERDGLAGQDKSGYTMAFSPDAKTAAIGGPDGKVQPWDLESKTPRPLAQEPRGNITSVAYSPDGKWLACSSWDGKVTVWKSEKKWREWQLPGPVWGVSFAHDNQHLATANSNGTVYVFRLADAAP